MGTKGKRRGNIAGIGDKLPHNKRPRATTTRNFSGDVPRERANEPTFKTEPLEGLLTSILGSTKILDIAYRSERGMIPDNNMHGYVRTLFRAGMSLASLTAIPCVHPRNRKSFMINPIDYMDVTSLLVVWALTGITLDRQLQLLVFGASYTDTKNGDTNVLITLQSLIANTKEAKDAPNYDSLEGLGETK